MAPERRVHSDGLVKAVVIGANEGVGGGDGADVEGDTAAADEWRALRRY